MRVCLITCNIRFDNPHDGSNSWIHRRLFLTETLLKHSPEIIATQEGRYDQLKDMETLLEDYVLIDQHRSWIKQRMYPSFFVRKNIFEILKSGDLWLSETPEIAGSISFDSSFPRLMTWIKLQPNNSDKSVLIVNTHLDHVRPETRLCQVQVLINQIENIKDAGTPLIIMGDFNDSPDSPVRKKIYDSFQSIQDAWKVFNQNEESSHHAFTGEMQNGTRIDWILVDHQFKVDSCIMDKSSKAGKYPTDHFPIICTLNL